MVSDAKCFTAACYPNLYFPDRLCILAKFDKSQLPRTYSPNLVFIVLTTLGTNIAFCSSLKNEKLSLA